MSSINLPASRELVEVGKDYKFHITGLASPAVGRIDEITPTTIRKPMILRRKKVEPVAPAPEPKTESIPQMKPKKGLIRKKVIPVEEPKPEPKSESKIITTSTKKDSTSYFHISPENKEKLEKLKKLYKSTSEKDKNTSEKIYDDIRNLEDHIIKTATKLPTKQITYILPQKQKGQKIMNPKTKKIQKIIHKTHHSDDAFTKYKTMLEAPDNIIVYNFLQTYWTEERVPAHTYEKQTFRFHIRPQDDISVVDYPNQVTRHLTNEEIDHINKVLARMPPKIEK